MTLGNSYRIAVAAVLAAALGLAGCGPMLVQESARGPWTPIPPGSTLTLNRPVQVPQDQAQVVLRDGQISQIGINLGPSCALQVRRISHAGPQRIAPQSFQIARVQVYWAQVAYHRRAAAARLLPAHWVDDGGGGNPMIQDGYHLWLEGPDRNVMRLTCLGMLNEMSRSRPITLDEIRAALGDVATLRVAGAR
ncbi:hypothetical protein [uncultured Thiodictyon sp.]|uniref:hypothetical protein n=1 Tax=uncultured Thiodictyon sp. TaxID=1846217 RepID=UPI0025F4DEB8|nr:hypothetical protein [uncultured Thiodictyon sp.]